MNNCSFGSVELTDPLQSNLTFDEKVLCHGLDKEERDAYRNKLYFAPMRNVLALVMKRLGHDNFRGVMKLFYNHP